MSAAESVDDLAQMKQIVDPAEVGRRLAVIGRTAAVVIAPAGPPCGDQRTAAVRQAYEQKHDATAPNAADHGQGLAFESMPLAGYRHPLRDLAVMGSLVWLPSTQ